MNRVVFIGVYPGLSQAMLDHTIGTIRSFVRSR
jgi:CDP-6-deoxy-D-xylo-4-hexulose-3-dehydrase